MDARVAPREGVARDPHRPGTGDAVEVVPEEIDDHRELGAILLATPELAKQTTVLVPIPAPGASALDGPGPDLAALHPEEALGRGGEHDAAPGVEEAGVGAGVGGPESPVELHVAPPERSGEAAREVHLVDLAVVDQLADAADAREVLLPVHRRAQTPEHRWVRLRRVVREVGRRQRRSHRAEGGPVVGAGLANEHPVVEADGEIGDRQVARGVCGEPLEVRPEIVPEHARQARPEPAGREERSSRRGDFPEVPPEEVQHPERIALEPEAAAVEALDLARASGHADLEQRVEGQVGAAPQPSVREGGVEKEYVPRGPQTAEEIPGTHRSQPRRSPPGLAGRATQAGISARERRRECSQGSALRVRCETTPGGTGDRRPVRDGAGPP
jgi:hypothetical protein